MTWFNFPKKKLVLHCYTARAEVFNYAPIQKASAFLPDWWRNLPLSIPHENGMFPVSTMKGCVGLTQLYKHGVIIPMWSDLSLRIGQTGSTDYAYQYSDKRSEIQTHGVSQNGGRYLDEEYQHLKIISPWVFKCDEDVSFLNIAPTWNLETVGDINVLPGAVDYKYQAGTNVNIFIKRKNTVEQYLIPFNQPLVHIIPTTDKKLEIKTHLVSQEELAQIGRISAGTKFLKKYLTNRSVLKERGCPFHYKVEK